MIKKHKPFLISIFGGILMWFFVFTVFPAKVIFPFSKETFNYILFSYLALIIGYFITPTLKDKKGKNEISKKFVYILVFISVISFVIRYIDLFLVREVSFKNSIWQNRELLDKTKPNLIFILASIFKSAYFVPIIFVLKQKLRGNKILIVSLLLFLLPFIEGVIRGSRNSFFIPTVLLFLIYLYLNKIRFNRKHLAIIFLSVLILFTTATSIIMAREASKTDKNLSSLTTNFFLNKFLEPKPWVFKKINATENITLKKAFVSSLQFCQYYVHGIFEFDNLVKYYQKKPFYPQYGKFTFFTINKFFNKYNFSNTDLEKVQEMNPRRITFITFFGGLFIDFGWFGIFVMFIYGSFQRYLYNSILNNKIIYLPLLIFLLFCNFFMLTFNFIKNNGTNILVVCLTLIMVYGFFNTLKPFNK